MRSWHNFVVRAFEGSCRSLCLHKLSRDWGWQYPTIFTVSECTACTHALCISVTAYTLLAIASSHSTSLYLLRTRYSSLEVSAGARARLLDLWARNATRCPPTSVPHHRSA